LNDLELSECIAGVAADMRELVQIISSALSLSVEARSWLVDLAKREQTCL